MSEAVDAMKRYSEESATRAAARREAIAQGVPVEPNLLERLAALEAKADEIAKTTRRLYTIFLWTGIVTVLAIVLPLILMAFALPSLLSTYSSALGI